jgi:hypothetical protein
MENATQAAAPLQKLTLKDFESFGANNLMMKRHTELEEGKLLVKSKNSALWL